MAGACPASLLAMLPGANWQTGTPSSPRPWWRQIVMTRNSAQAMPSADTVVSVRHVTKRFPGVTALDDVVLEVRRGEVHAIVGENGAGKSTLMKILSGAITDYDGQIELNGRTVRFAGTRDAEAAGISIIYQELNLVDELSAAANIFLGRELRTRLGFLDDPRMERLAAERFAILGATIVPGEPVGRLRVGDQQVVEIAKALLLDADVVIMDEPTSALSEAEVERLFDVIANLKARGVTVLYISHKMDEVFRIADRISVLRDGKLVWSTERRRTAPDEITRQMVGREIASLQLVGERKTGDELLRVEGLSLPWPERPGRWRLKAVDFVLHEGEILGVAGLMGAGRTELLECLFGASAVAPSGRIVLDSEPIRPRHPAEAVAAGLALVTEDRKRFGLFDQMSVAANITLADLRELARSGLIAASQEAQAVDRSIRELGIRTAGGDAPVTSLSGGNQQKCIVARWLLTRPKVLLLDEPTRGIDVGAKAELYVLFDELCRAGLAILMTSSELPELLTVCDRIMVLSEGRKTAEFPRGEATEEQIMRAALRGANGDLA